NDEDPSLALRVSNEQHALVHTNLKRKLRDRSPTGCRGLCGTPSLSSRFGLANATRKKGRADRWCERTRAAGEISKRAPLTPNSPSPSYSRCTPRVPSRP